jgi:hypothetical protein
MKNFRQMEKILLGEQIAGEKMSHFPTRTQVDKYEPQNFNHYRLNNVTEQEALKTVSELRQLFYSELPYKLSALAGYHRNDTILKVYDDFLTNLRTQAGVKV